MTPRCDPRRLRAAAQRRADAAARRRRRVPLGADWLVGINGTRAMTAFNSKSGGFQLTTVGRVQTPTLAILVEREEKIRAFVPRDYWEVVGTFRAAAGEYTGRWFDEKFKRAGRRPRSARRADLERSAGARARRRSARASPASSPRNRSPRSQSPPLLYDLTSLQREANGRFGFSARTTLSLAQALYEKHKVLTYPRTDSRALPEDYIDDGARSTLEGARRDERLRQRSRGEILKQEVGRTEQADLRQREGLRPLRDHPDARRRPKHLNEIEQKLYDLVVQALPRRVLSGGGVPRDHAHHARRDRAVQDRKGKVLVDPGLARRVRQGSCRARSASLDAGQAEREGRDREGRRRARSSRGRRRG